MRFQNIGDLGHIYKFWMKKYEINLKRLDVISSNECILDIFEEKGFEDDYVEVLEGLALHIGRNGANVVVKLQLRQIYEDILEFLRRLGIIDSHVVLQEAMSAH